MTTYSRIVFLQGEEYEEFGDILDDRGEDEAMDYLIQWDYGTDDDLHDESSSGRDDAWMRRDMGDFTYLMTWDRTLGYAGLERILSD